MVFRRKIYKDLLNWKNNSLTLKSGLLIEGPRRVGKTTIIEEFAKKEYKNYLLIDFMYASDELKGLFDHLDDLDSFFSNLFLYCGKALKPGDLIIFDEVQWCPKARQGIKKFVNDGRFDYIETGSLLSIRENVSNITIPSEETRIEMYPMDFEEFLWAIKKDDIAQLIKDAYNKKFVIQNSIHENLIKLFRQYLAIGGMPRVINDFILSNSYLVAHKAKQDILKLYKDDLFKHDTKYKTICRAVYESIPSQLLSNSSRFVTFNDEKGKQRYDQYEDTFVDIKDSKTINMVNCISDPSIGFEMSKKDSMFKLFSCDTGLLVTSIFKNQNQSVEEIYKSIIFDKSDMNLGKIFESIVAQALIANGIEPYYHSFDKIKDDKEKHYEIDFIALIKGKRTAIEVKSGKNFTTSSLDNLSMKYPQLSFRKIVISEKPYSIKNEVTYLPIYMTFCL